MKTANLMCLILALFTLAACGGSGSGDGDAAAKAVVPSPQLPEEPAPQTPTDYSNVACGDTNECASVCDMDKPATSQASIEHLCDITQVADSTCKGLKDWHDITYLKENFICRNLNVAGVIDTELIGTESCASSASCVAKCNLRFKPLTDNQVINSHGGSIGSAMLKSLVRNQLIRESLAACLDSPKDHVD